MSPEAVIVTIVTLPWAAAAMIFLSNRWPNLREAFSFATATGLVVLLTSNWSRVTEGERPGVTLFETLPGLPVAFQIEPLGLLFALTASVLWLITTLYSVGYMRSHGEHHQTRFYAFFSLAMGSTMGVALAANLFTLFVFYELLTLTTYPLVTHKANHAARDAGRVYFGFLLGSSIGLFLLALIWTWSLTGTLEFREGGILEGQIDPIMGGVLLLLYLFGIGKAALMPLHRWLPAAMVAPTPVSALLHAVAVVKAGVFTVLKLIVYVFGVDFVAELPTTQFLIYLACATVLLASLIAWRQDNLKRRLAYSTVSQLSYILLAALMASPLAVLGGGLHILTHAFGKITLFFCAGAILVATHKTHVSEMRGIGRSMPFTMAAFLIAALSIVGLPPLGGFWSKWFLALGTLESDQIIVLIVLLASSLLNVAYLIPIPIRGFFRPEDSSQAVGIKEGPKASVAALLITASGCLILFIMPQPIYDLLQQLANR
jgi:multicomponent Na+:H+ antiporter subunit D